MLKCGDLVKPIRGIIMDVDDPRKVKNLKPERAFWFEYNETGVILEIGKTSFTPLKTQKTTKCPLIKILCPKGVGFFYTKNANSYFAIM